MSFHQIPAGKNIPEDIYVIIEIPAHSDPIKYEINKKTGIVFVDRFLLTPMFYPCNYGYINNTLSLDGDPVDILVPTPYPLRSGCVIRCRPIGILNMIDESGEDAKIIAVPHDKISEQYSLIKDINDIPDLLRKQINHFFKNYKDLDSGKWVKIKSWGNINAAKTEILNSFERFKNNI
ncbi:inorganic diphosphatase [Blochmannia endosymbiont of Camponotus nipponensis]|uniref:inorganic diphosphatase n=1 Tax=Blochmannia endosymbiont of Camponotus nipponensis TaxID=2681986 RepID=UPI00135BBD27|nr:inorganic diphosphatase [Blochmannia endosymbiont of Camponotus nipponensis]